MKKKWRYANRSLLHWAGARLIVAALLLLTACHNRDEHTLVAGKKTTNVDDLVRPVNATVLSSVSTTTPIEKSIHPLLQATGVIAYNPQLVNNISARYTGRIEKLYVRFNFQPVTKGQRLMDIYSPDILTEQQNLIYLLRNSPADTALIHSSKEKLKLLGLTEQQLAQLTTTRQAINPLPVYSPYNGHIHDLGISTGAESTATNMDGGMGAGMGGSSTVTPQVQIENLPSSRTSALSVKEGMYVQSGQTVFAVYNISQVWAVLNIFQKDAAWLKVGDRVSIFPETNYRDTIHAVINYIEPVAGKNASAIKARVYLNNDSDRHLKIGTLLSAAIGTAAIKGWWLPRNAVVNIGKRHVVFIQSGNQFTAKPIETGFQNDSLIQVTNGLTGSDTVAANAQYLVDSESFIKTSDHDR